MSQWSQAGPRHILGRQRHPAFVSDPTMERYTLTFNRGGYLKRMGGR